VDLSVVVCAHNEARCLGDQLDALLAQDSTCDFEVVVVDNRSTDGTAQLVESYAAGDSRIRLVTANERADKSYAMNVGVESAQSDRLAFCDGDDIVGIGWVDAVATGLDRHQVVTGPHELDRLNPPWLAESRGRSMEVEPAGSFVGIFPTIRGAGWGVRRSVWDSLGGMSERYHPVEDLEFSFRCWMSGIDVVGVPTAVVHYRYRTAIGDLWRQGYAYGSHRPLIARLVNDSGRTRAPRFSGWKSWAVLALSLPAAMTAEGRARFAWVAANRVGQVVGSIRHRTLML